MLSIPQSLRILVARHPADFRKQFDGLSGIVRAEFGHDPLCGHLFVFFNKRRDRIKMLVFEHTGFWLHYKRLERGTFESLAGISDECNCIEIDARRLRLLLEGIDLTESKFRKHFGSSLRIRDRQTSGEQQRQPG